MFTLICVKLVSFYARLIYHLRYRLVDMFQYETCQMSLYYFRYILVALFQYKTVKLFKKLPWQLLFLLSFTTYIVCFVSLLNIQAFVTYCLSYDLQMSFVIVHQYSTMLLLCIVVHF
jgi:hypothetical protein